MASRIGAKAPGLEKFWVQSAIFMVFLYLEWGLFVLSFELVKQGFGIVGVYEQIHSSRHL